MKKGFDINFLGQNSRFTRCTALHCATKSGREAVVRLLLENGANVNVNDSNGRTALHVAAPQGGDGRIVQMLLEMGAQHDIVDVSGNTPLQVAAVYRAEGSVKALLKGGADVNAPDRAGMRPLHLAITGEGPASHEVVRMLIEGGADVSAKDSVGQTALYLAVRKGQEDVVGLILALGGDTSDSRSGLRTTGQNALQVAASFGYEGILRQLMAKGTGQDLTYRDHDGYTALDHVVISACRFPRRSSNYGDHRTMVGLLLEGQRVKVYSLKTLNNVLLWAAEEGHRDIFNLLIENGAEISCQHHSIPWIRTDGRVGDTVLHVAAEYGQLAIVRVLVEMGADFRARNRLGSTPLDLAQRSMYMGSNSWAKEEIIEILRNKGAISIHQLQSNGPNRGQRNHRRDSVWDKYG